MIAYEVRKCDKRGCNELIERAVSMRNRKVTCFNCTKKRNLKDYSKRAAKQKLRKFLRGV